MSLCWSIFVHLHFLLAHGDLSVRIEALSQSIQQFPDSLELYIARGELYLQDENPDSAYLDFVFCLQQGQINSRVYEGLSKSTGNNNAALEYINLALEKDSISLSALEWKARLCFSMFQYCTAGRIYEELIDRSNRASPDLYINASNSWKNCSEENGAKHSVLILETGISHIGPLHVLEKQLVELYEEQKNFEQAIKIQSALLDQATNKAISYFTRAELYIKADNLTSAKLDLQQALLAIDQLPDNKRSLAVMMEYRSKIESTLTKLNE